MESLLALVASLEHSALGEAARSSPWLYPVANLLHVLGAALLVGAAATFDVAVLRGSQTSRFILRAGIPIAAAGLAVQIASGIVLFAAEAGPLLRNTAFLAKLAFIVVGIANVGIFHLLFGTALRERQIPPGARITAAVSLFGWTVALLLGRTIAYV